MDESFWENSTPKTGAMRCLVQFSQEFHWVNFRFAELDALLILSGIEPAAAYTFDETKNGTDNAFLRIDLPGWDVARSMCERSILIKAIYELWCIESTLGEVIESAKLLPISFLEPHMSLEKSWSVNVDTHCKSYSMSEKEFFRNQFRFLDFKGKVSLDDADVQLWILLDHSLQKNDGEVIAHNSFRRGSFRIIS